MAASLGELNLLPSNLSAITLAVPSASIRTRFLPACWQEMIRPCWSRMLPLACSLGLRTPSPDPALHCINLLLGISEKTSFFSLGSQTGPSVNFMPPASLVTLAPGARIGFSAGSARLDPIAAAANAKESHEMWLRMRLTPGASIQK